MLSTNEERMKKYWYISSDGRIEIKLTMNQAMTGSHQGKCDQDIEYLRTIPEIENQLLSLQVEAVASELLSSGAYDKDELRDHNENLSRILWFACSDIVENYR